MYDDDVFFATVKMPFSLFKKLKKDNPDMVLKKVKDLSIDYSKHKEWNEAKKLLIKEVKNIEDIESDIRYSMLK